MEIIPGFLVGFLGSLHCAGMCGPLALALPRGPGGTASFAAGRLLYNGGRVVTYILLGVIAGSVGKAVALAGWQQIFTIALGMSLVLVGLLPSALRVVTARLSLAARAGAAVRNAIARFLGHPAPGTLFLTGLANGLLPCGFVYAAMAAAAALGTVVSSALFMAGFGIGTVPVMFGISLAGPRLAGVLRGRWGVLLPVLTVVLGLLIVLRGLDLGIPFISPPLPQDTPAAVRSCH